MLIRGHDWNGYDTFSENFSNGYCQKTLAHKPDEQILF